MDKKANLKFINRDMLKYFAVTVMFVGHFILYTTPELHLTVRLKPIGTWLVLFAHMAPPIFFFFIAEGFRYTKSKKKYALRLLGFALAAQFAYVLCHHLHFDVRVFFTDWNVIMTLFLGFMALIVWECKLPLPVRLLLIMAFCVASFFTEWSITGVLIILALHILRERPYLRLAVYEIIIFAYMIIGLGSLGAVLTRMNLITIIMFTVPMIIITFFYNGEKGKNSKFSKYFFYIFYPAHLLIAFIVRVIAVQLRY